MPMAGTLAAEEVCEEVVPTNDPGAKAAVASARMGDGGEGMLHAGEVEL